MAFVQGELTNMQPGEIKTLKYQGYDFKSDYKYFLPLIEEVIQFALQGKLKILESSYQISDTQIPYIDKLTFKRLI